MDMTVLTETVSPYLAPVKSALERIAETVAAAIPALAPYKEALWWMIPASAVILILFLLVVRAALKAPKKQPGMPAEATPSAAQPTPAAKSEPQAAPKASAPKPAPAADWQWYECHWAVGNRNGNHIGSNIGSCRITGLGRCSKGEAPCGELCSSDGTACSCT